MKLPDWLRASRTYATNRTVTVDLVLDTSKLDASMGELIASVERQKWRSTIRRERLTARRSLDDALFALCDRYGIDPEVWIVPRTETTDAWKQARAARSSE